MKRLAFVPLAVGTALFCAACSGGSDSSAPSSAGGATAPLPSVATFASVKTLLDSKCAGCHGARAAGGLSTLTYASLMKGGRDGAVVKAGDPGGSILIDYLNGTKKPQMPLRSAPLSADDIKTFTDWIAAGAKES